MSLKTFIYESQLYIRCIPAKSLFKSSLVHEVINRGDIFAIRVSDQSLTIIPGKSQVEHTEHDIIRHATNKTPATSIDSKTKTTAERHKLKQIADELRAGKPKQRSLFGDI